MKNEPTPQTPFGNWLAGSMRRRGWNQSDLARAAGIKQNTISMWLTSERVPEKPNVEKVAIALAPEGAGGDIVQGMINEALEAAFGYDEHEVIDFLRGQPDPIKDKAYRMLKAAFAEEDAADNAGNVGKRAD